MNKILILLLNRFLKLQGINTNTHLNRLKMAISYNPLLIIYMNKDILKKELDKLGVNPNEYSLNGNIESDKIVLYQNYSKWEVFYFDERGGRNCEKVFCNEEDACSYIYELFKSNK